jgi:uncharacterized membrane protein
MMNPLRVFCLVLATLIRAASAAALGVEVLSVAVHHTPLPTRPYLGQMGLGWWFWSDLRDMAMGVAASSLVGCVVLSVTFRAFGDTPVPNTRWCVWAAVATITLAILIPGVYEV